MTLDPTDVPAARLDQIEFNRFLRERAFNLRVFSEAEFLSTVPEALHDRAKEGLLRFTEKFLEVTALEPKHYRVSPAELSRAGTIAALLRRVDTQLAPDTWVAAVAEALTTINAFRDVGDQPHTALAKDLADGAESLLHAASRLRLDAIPNLTLVEARRVQLAIVVAGLAGFSAATGRLPGSDAIALAIQTMVVESLAPVSLVHRPWRSVKAAALLLPPSESANAASKRQRVAQASTPKRLVTNDDREAQMWSDLLSTS
jgi:hypothetical protein